MAFVTLEDLQGTVELVVFPRTWEKVSGIVQIDRIMLVEGKVDTQSGDPKVLVDKISREFTRTVGYDPDRTGFQKPAVSTKEKPANEGKKQQKSADKSAARTTGPNEPTISKVEAPGYLEVSKPDSVIEHEAVEITANTPPPPDDPPDWLELQISNSAKISKQDQSIRFTAPETMSKGVEIPSQLDAITLVDNSAAREESEPENSSQRIADIEGTEEPASEDRQLLKNGTAEALPLQPYPEIPLSETVKKPPVIIPPQRKSGSGDLGGGLSNMHSYLVPPLHGLDESGEVKMLTVTLRATGDKTRDVLRLRRLQGCIISYPGDDRYTVQIYERGKRYLIEFPNSTTQVCQELLGRLISMVGAENIVVEPIRFQ